MRTSNGDSITPARVNSNGKMRAFIIKQIKKNTDRLTCGADSDLEDVLGRGLVERIQDSFHVVEKVGRRVLERKKKSPTEFITNF